MASLSTILEGLGKVENTLNLSLIPHYVLVGDQSAGRSSLLDGILGIKVSNNRPISTSFTIRTRYAPDDAFVILLRTEFRRLFDRPGDTFTAWAPQEPTSEEFATGQDLDQDSLVQLLRWARVVTLNPSQWPPRPADRNKNTISRFAEALQALEAHTEISISPNQVVLEVSGP
jgi:hypothetical protein